MAGDWHMLAVEAGGNVWAWGTIGSGATGDGTFTSSSSPVQVLGPGGTGLLGGIVAVAGGGGSSDEHSLGLKDDGTVWAFGSNTSGQLGNGTNTASNVPVQVTDPGDVSGYLTGVVAVAASYDYSLAVKADGTLWSWGINDEGLLGTGNNSVSLASSNVPVPVCAVGATAPCSVGAANVLTNVVAASGSFYHAVALRGDGTVVTWGANWGNQLGDGSTTLSLVPVEVCGFGATAPCNLSSGNRLTGVVAVSTAGDSAQTLALKSDGTVLGWGDESNGDLGSGTTTGNQSTPISVCAVGTVGACAPGSGDLTEAIAVAAGRYHSVVLLSDKTVVTFGWNSFGQLGDGTLVQAAVPVAVPGLTGVEAITATGNGSHVMLANGEVWGWGWNDNNELAATPDGSPCNGRSCNRNPVRAGTIDLIP